MSLAPVPQGAGAFLCVSVVHAGEAAAGKDRALLRNPSLASHVGKRDRKGKAVDGLQKVAGLAPDGVARLQLVTSAFFRCICDYLCAITYGRRQIIRLLTPSTKGEAELFLASLHCTMNFGGCA